MESWIEQLLPIIEEYRGGAVSFANDPLDGDGVDDLVKIIKAKINLHEGNITEKEYNKILG
jgi:hypothetical protein